MDFKTPWEMDSTLIKTFEFSELLNMDTIKKFTVFKNKFAIQGIIQKVEGNIQKYSGEGEHIGLYEFNKAKVIITDIDIPIFLGTQLEGYLDGKYFVPTKIKSMKVRGKMNGCEIKMCKYWSGQHCEFEGNYCCQRSDDEIIKELDARVNFLNGKIKKLQELNRELVTVLQELNKYFDFEEKLSNGDLWIDDVSGINKVFKQAYKILEKIKEEEK